MQQIFQKINELEAEFKLLQPISIENKKRLDKKFRLEFNYNSNHLEGNTLTYGETELLLIFDETKGNHSLREYEEMKAHDAALHFIENLANEKERPLTEQIIKDLNQIILVRPYWKDAQTPDGINTRRQIKVGDYKDFANSVRLQNGEIFEYASPTDTPILMSELIDWFRENENKLNAVTLAAQLHYKFVCIHPFDDGNGRLSRLLMNYVFLKNNFPPIIIKSSDKTNYLRALHLADTGDFESFENYIAEQLIWTLEISIKAAKGENIEEKDDFEKELNLLEKEIKRIEGKETKEKRSSENIKFIVNNYIFQLWNELHIKLVGINNLFNDFDSYYFINETDTKFNAKIDFEAAILREISNDEKVFNMRFVYELIAFKKSGINPFDIVFYFVIRFNDWNFSIEYYKDNGPIVKKYLYDSKLSLDEIQIIVNEIANNLLEKVKLQINELTNKK